MGLLGLFCGSPGGSWRLLGAAKLHSGPRQKSTSRHRSLKRRSKGRSCSLVKRFSAPDGAQTVQTPSPGTGAAKRTAEKAKRRASEKAGPKLIKIRLRAFSGLSNGAEQAGARRTGYAKLFLSG